MLLREFGRLANFGIAPPSTSLHRHFMSTCGFNNLDSKVSVYTYTRNIIVVNLFLLFFDRHGRIATQSWETKP
jgi:hypothetical protein